MMEQGITYKLSKGIRQTKRRYITLAILLPIILIAYLFLTSMGISLSLNEKIGVGLFSFIVLGSSFYFSSTKALQNLSRISVHIHPDRLERKSRNQTEIFFWKDVSNAEIVELPSGEIATIKLTFANKKTIYLWGFEDMKSAANQIAESIHNKDLIHQKKSKINWGNPIIMILTGILTLAIILAADRMGTKAYYLFVAIFFLSFGLYVIFASPISSAQGKGYRKLELGMGVALLVFAIAILASDLLLFFALK